MGVLGHNARWRRGWITGTVGVLILMIMAGCTGGTTQPVAVATATPTAAPIATLTPTAAPVYYYQNTLTTSAPGWGTDQNCFFGSYGFHVKPNLACQSPVQNVGAVDVSVTMEPISGAPTDENGIQVRRSGDPASLYEFDITETGAWSFEVCVNGYDHCKTLTSGVSPAIHNVIGAVDTVEVRAVGSHFTLLVNGIQVGLADDATLASGDVWLETDGTSECVFTNFVATRPT